MHVIFNSMLFYVSYMHCIIYIYIFYISIFHFIIRLSLCIYLYPHQVLYIKYFHEKNDKQIKLYNTIQNTLEEIAISMLTHCLLNLITLHVLVIILGPSNFPVIE